MGQGPSVSPWARWAARACSSTSIVSPLWQITTLWAFGGVLGAGVGGGVGRGCDEAEGGGVESGGAAGGGGVGGGGGGGAGGAGGGGVGGGRGGAFCDARGMLLVGGEAARAIWAWPFWGTDSGLGAVTTPLVSPVTNRRRETSSFA